jgi:hypothetical protein
MLLPNPLPLLSFFEPGEPLFRDPGVNRDCGFSSSNVVGMDVLFDSLVECGPMKD